MNDQQETCRYSNYVNLQVSTETLCEILFLIHHPFEAERDVFNNEDKVHKSL